MAGQGKLTGEHSAKPARPQSFQHDYPDSGYFRANVGTFPGVGSPAYYAQIADEL